MANTVAAMAHEDKCLLSAFFCKRDNTYLSNATKILPAIAYRFAEQHESFRVDLVKFFQPGTEGVGIADTTDISTQFKLLFSDARISATTDPCRPHLVVFDAADESGDAKERRRLMNAALALARAAPWIRVLVTSRDEPEIEEVMTAAIQTQSCIGANINDETQVGTDIYRYIKAQAADIGLALTPDEVSSISRLSDGLFIWASTLFKYLSDAISPRAELDRFLQDHGRGTAVLSSLDRLYAQVITSATKLPHDSAFLHAILETICLTSQNRPLSAPAVASFLVGHETYAGRDIAQVAATVKTLHSVLYTEPNSGAVRAHHTSFYDFLLRQLESSADGSWSRMAAAHRRMLERCLDIMKEELRFNICSIEVPKLNSEVPDLQERIQTNISEHLQYSALYWHRHLPLDETDRVALLPKISNLLCTKKFLFWLESLSLLRALSHSLQALDSVRELYQVRRKRCTLVMQCS